VELQEVQVLDLAPAQDGLNDHLARIAKALDLVPQTNDPHHRDTHRALFLHLSNLQIIP
jgi:hypothetical protein